jgi:hypothetical protein
MYYIFGEDNSCSYLFSPMYTGYECTDDYFTHVELFQIAQKEPNMSDILELFATNSFKKNISERC